MISTLTELEELFSSRTTINKLIDDLKKEMRMQQAMDMLFNHEKAEKQIPAGLKILNSISKKVVVSKEAILNEALTEVNTRIASFEEKLNPKG